MGRVRSLKTSSQPKVLSQSEGGGGYLYVGLWAEDQNNASWEKVHHLVAAEFIEEPREDKLVLHKNDNKHDNRAENLYYGSYQDNADDKQKNNLQPRGEEFDRKLTEKDVLEIRRSDKPHSEIAPEYGVEESTIGEIRRGEIWTHVGGPTDKTWEKEIEWGKWEHLFGEIPDSEIADRIGCARSSVWQQRTERGISAASQKNSLSDHEAEMVRSEYRDEDYSQRDLAKKYSVSQETIRRAIHKKGAYSHVE